MSGGPCCFKRFSRRCTRKGIKVMTTAKEAVNCISSRDDFIYSLSLTYEAGTLLSVRVKLV